MEPKLLFERDALEDVTDDAIDGMDTLLGDDILSTDYDGGIEEWPGVPDIEIPEAYRVPDA